MLHETPGTKEHSKRTASRLEIGRPHHCCSVRPSSGVLADCRWDISRVAGTVRRDWEIEYVGHREWPHRSQLRWRRQDCNRSRLQPGGFSRRVRQSLQVGTRARQWRNAVKAANIRSRLETALYPFFEQIAWPVRARKYASSLLDLPKSPFARSPSRRLRRPMNSVSVACIPRVRHLSEL